MPRDKAAQPISAYGPYQMGELYEIEYPELMPVSQRPVSDLTAEEQAAEGKLSAEERRALYNKRIQFAPIPSPPGTRQLPMGSMTGVPKVSREERQKEKRRRMGSSHTDFLARNFGRGRTK